MIPKLNFPIEKLQLVLLYKNEAVLEKIKASSEMKAPLSKVSAAYHDLFFPAPPEDRPYTFSSMVLSVDGKMAFQDNPQGPVVASANQVDPTGGLTDFWILNVLRAHADAIVVGAKTLNSEPDVVFSCLDPDLVAERSERLGKKNEFPLNVIVSLDGKDVPFGHSLFTVPELQTLIATCHAGGQYLREQYGEEALLVGPYDSIAQIDVDQAVGQIRAGLAARKKVVLMTGENTPDAGCFLFVLRKMGIQYLLLESPTYTWLLMAQQMLDEFFLNYSTLYIGGPITPGYANGFSHLDHPHAQFLVIAMHQNSFLFTRQKILYGWTDNSPA